MRCISGTNWGANTKLLTITYKTLIRSIIDYASFIPIVSGSSTNLIIERIQRRALKIAYKLPFFYSTKGLYQIVNIPDVKTRAMSMCEKYIVKASKTNQLIQELITNYKTSEPLEEGLFCKRPQSTLLSHFKQLM